MAEPISVQQLKDASLDVKSLEEVVNGDENVVVTTRLGETYPSVKGSIKELFEKGGLPATPFATKALMTASALADGNYAMVTDDTVNNGLYVKTSGSWVKSGYDPVNQSIEYVDSSATFKPVLLRVTDQIDSMEEAGTYHVSRDSEAVSLNLPTGRRGQLYISRTFSLAQGSKFQTYINDRGEVFQRAFSSSWSSWKGYRHETLIAPKNLNDIVDAGTYLLRDGLYTTAELNSPFSGTGALLIVFVDEVNGRVRQQMLSSRGTAQRYGNKSGTVYSWVDWAGVDNSGEVGVVKLDGYIKKADVDIDSYISKGTVNVSLLTSTAGFSENLDNFFEVGEYYIQSGQLVTTLNGFPITGSGGYLTVFYNDSASYSQYWRCINGWAYRYSRYQNGAHTWQPWSGIKKSQVGVIDIGNQPPAEAGAKNLIVYGSSTMSYLSNQLADFAADKNLVFKNHGISGDTLGGSGQAQGSNVVNIKFSGGVISASIAVPVTVTATFGKGAEYDRNVELSNGVLGILGADGTFRATNLSEDMAVVATAEFLVKEPEWFKVRDGIYIFNIGKNDMWYSGDNSQAIVDRTTDMINYIPKTSDFIVGGHFTNTDSNDANRTVVENTNAALKLKYGLKYFDINELLFADSTWVALGLTKTSEDVAAISTRRLPPSLARDKRHLTDAMSDILAEAIKSKLLQLGYVS